MFVATIYVDANGKEIKPPRGFANPTSKRVLTAKEAKMKVEELIAAGASIVEAMGAVDRKEATYHDWRKTDPTFRSRMDTVRQVQREVGSTGRPPIPAFDVFCREYLKQPLNPHQLRMWDVIEGRPPRDMHDAMDYEPGDPTRILINVPPDHAKSTTFTVNYTVYKIHEDPDIRIVILSQAKKLAKEFLYEIKQKLTNPLYREMHLRFAPNGGWKDPDNSWSADAIYVSGGAKVGKDPTVQALGWGGSIYGTRSDLIFMDDVISTKNCREAERQQVLLEREVESRLPSEDEGGGKLVILGTRVSPVDLYKQLQDVTDHDDERVWTYFRQPAVLDYGAGSSDSWVTLWPERWSGKALAKRKRGDASWNLIYQQLNVSEEMTFKAEAVNCSIEGRRFPGVMSVGAMGHRPDGMSGLVVVGGLDPATVNNTAMVVVGFDPVTEKRYVLDGFDKKACSPTELREKVKQLTDLYRVQVWVIERNAFQRFLTQDPELVNWLRTRGSRIEELYTTANKFDSDFGIQTMGPLFESCGHPTGERTAWKRTPETALIELPNVRQNGWAANLVQQLTAWEPQGMAQKSKTDLVMALWFTHTYISRLLQKRRDKKQWSDNPFMSRGAQAQRQVVNLTEIRRQRQETMMGATGG